MARLLVDYNGKFDPKLSHHGFTKETVTKLLRMYSEYMISHDV
jgi:hypothetical protein